MPSMPFACTPYTHSSTPCNKNQIACSLFLGLCWRHILPKYSAQYERQTESYMCTCNCVYLAFYSSAGLLLLLLCCRRYVVYVVCVCLCVIIIIIFCVLFQYERNNHSAVTAANEKISPGSVVVPVKRNKNFWILPKTLKQENRFY